MKKLLAGIIVSALSVQLFSGTVAASAAEAGSAVTDKAVVGVSEESPGQDSLSEPDAETEGTKEGEYDYPKGWDLEDPLNERAYEQIYGDSEAVEEAPVLYSSRASSNNGLQTTWGSTTYTHNDYNSDGKIITMGIDVSYHNGTIDWSKVKASGVEFAILRVGYRAYRSGSIGADSKFQIYIRDAQKAGIKVGVYFFSQAINEKEAVEEANYVLETLEKYGYNIDLPVAFDYEYAGDQLGRLYEANLNKAQKTKNAAAFCKTVEDAGYDAMVYSNASWYYSELDAVSLRENYDIWMARYNTFSHDDIRDAGKRLYSGQIDIWQCSSTAKVSGISTNVDLDYWYAPDDSANEKLSGLHYDSKGNLYYYTDGEIDTDFTGVEKNTSGWWYVEKGKVSFQYTGFVQKGDEWWYFENSKFASTKNDVIKGTVNGEAAWWYVASGKVSYTDTVAKNSNGWWRIEDGKVNFDYNGVAKNENGWWYIANGQVDFNYNGVAQNENGWWYLEKGKVNFNYTGFAKKGSEWWYFENSKFASTKNDVIKGTVNGETAWWYIVSGKVAHVDTVAKNSNGWWYLESGKVNFNYTGFAKKGSEWWYFENSKFVSAKNDVIYGKVNGKNAWWYVVSGKVSYTDTVAKNSNGWWYIDNGKVNFDYNGFAQNSNGWWYLEKGKVTFAKNDVIKGKVDGVTAWWYVKGSKVTYTNTVAKNSNGWWYIDSGKVNFNYNGFAQNSNGWWYLENGKVTFAKNDVIYGKVDGVTAWWYVKGSKVTYTNTVAKNSNGWWYIDKGKVNFDYTGIARNENGWWYLENGKVNFNYNGWVTVGGTKYKVTNGKVAR